MSTLVAYFWAFGGEERAAGHAGQESAREHASGEAASR
jgi:hypothetical protein